MLQLVLLSLAILGAARGQSSDLFEAVRDDDPNAIRAALSSGSDINVIGPGGQTPLMNAVLSGKEAAVKALLAAGAGACSPSVSRSRMRLDA